MEDEKIFESGLMDPEDLEDVPEVNDDPEDDTPPPPEDGDTPPEPSEELSDTDKAFIESGLDKTYETPAQALKAHRESQAYITRLQQENGRLRVNQLGNNQPERTPPAIDGDALIGDPDAELRKAGYVKMTDVVNVVRRELSGFSSHMDAKTFASTTPDFHKYKGKMNDFLQSRPDIQHLIDSGAMPPGAAVELLYLAAKGMEGGAAPPPPNPPPANKDRAQTTGGTRGKTASSGYKSPEDFLNKAPLDEIEKVIGYGDD